MPFLYIIAGLDSSNASRVVDILSALASAGVTVIITIHQPRPDILRLMDRMLLLSGNGKVLQQFHLTACCMLAGCCQLAMLQLAKFSASYVSHVTRDILPATDSLWLVLALSPQLKTSCPTCNMHFVKVHMVIMSW